MYIIYFKVNSAVCELEFNEEQGDLYYELLTNNTFAMGYVLKLIKKGSFHVQGPVTTMHRALEINDLDINPDVLDIENYAEPISQDLEPTATQDPGMLTPPESQSTKSMQLPTHIVEEWGKAESQFLLNQMYQYMPQVGPQKKFRTKKAMWKQIADDISNKYNITKTDIQVENRYKTIMKCKKGRVDNNSTSGSCPMEIPFQEELQKIASLDDSIEPEVLRTSKGMKRLKEPSTCSPTSEISPKVRKTAVTVAEKLQKLHDKAEESRMKRHKEKMELVRQMWFGKIGETKDRVGESD